MDKKRINKSSQINPNDNIRKDDKQSQEEGYFDSLSKKYKIASKVLYVSMAICFLITLLFNAKLLTYNNFSYLMRDLDSAANLASENYNSISYSNDKLRVSKNFRGGMITASTTDMAIYTATGRKTLQMSETFIEPEIAVSKKYAIIYDLGGNNYSVYNSFTRVYHGKMDHGISYIVASDNGSYAIVSKDNEHTSIVYLYDKDFNLITTYSFGNKYVFAVALNDKGNKIAIATSEPNSNFNDFSTQVKIYEAEKGKLLFEYNQCEGLPCGSIFTDDKFYQIVTTKGLYSFERGSDTCKTYMFESGKLSKVSLNNEKCVLVLSEGKGKIINTILVFDKDGKLIYNREESNSVVDINNSKDYIFLNLSNEIVRINIKNGKTDTKIISDVGNGIIVYNNNNILYCCETKAKYIEF